MAGRIGDDEGAALCCEIAMRNIDGDALLAFGFEPIHQKSEIEIVPCRAKPSGIARQRLQLVGAGRAGLAV